MELSRETLSPTGTVGKLAPKPITQVLRVKILSATGIKTLSVTVPVATLTQVLAARERVTPLLQHDGKGYASLPAESAAKLTSQELNAAAAMIKGANLLHAMNGRDWSTVLELMPVVKAPSSAATPHAEARYIYSTHPSSNQNSGTQYPNLGNQTTVTIEGGGGVAGSLGSGSTGGAPATGSSGAQETCATMLSDIAYDASEAQQYANTVSSDVVSAINTVAQWLSVASLTPAQYSQMMSAAQAGLSALNSAANAAQSAAACAADAASQYSRAEAAKCSSANLLQMEALLQQTQAANQTAQNWNGLPFILAYQGIQQLLSTPQPAPSPASAPPPSCFQLDPPQWDGELDVTLDQTCTQDLVNFFSTGGVGNVVVAGISAAFGAATGWIGKLLAGLFVADENLTVADIKNNDTNNTGVMLHFSPFAWFTYGGMAGATLGIGLVDSGVMSGSNWTTAFWATPNPPA